MADNYARQARVPTASTPQFYNAVLLDIDGQLRTHNRSIATHFPSIPRPEYENIQIQYRGGRVNTLMREELNYEAERASAEAERMRATLVARKQASYDTIVTAVDMDGCGCGEELGTLGAREQAPK